MNAARHLAADCPVAFALRNLDAAGKPVEKARFSDGSRAQMKAIKLRKQDGQVRDVVGIDRDGNAWTIELGTQFTITRERNTPYVLTRRITPAKPALRIVK